MTLTLEKLAESIDRSDLPGGAYSALLKKSACKPPKNYIALKIYCEAKDSQVSQGLEKPEITLEGVGEEGNLAIINYVEKKLLDC